ncbi:Sec20-domain-containing protein [Amniculicola lignicola CBS 123094]|uniref:Sec20-domain-containing protein n=1 Tax=Amniculicola lignicola CBS 123094 TaxID=1392246 RepID=A0A6A5WJK9_9PLEO|nr:Sec20-domain-containing protein [Amniculicola lignicola CBS 123094]
MPPLPITTQTLSNRLTALSENNKGLTQLIQRLSKLDFQPGSVPLTSSNAAGDVDADARVELTAEIHETLKQLEEDLELLRQEVEDVVQSSAPNSRRRDSSRESEKSRLAVLLARLTEDLRSSRAQFRKAQIAAKRNADRAKLKERELLFSSLQSGTSTPSSIHRRKHNPNATEQEVIQSASSDVTAALRRTHQLMQTELSRSRFAQETLEQSTAALADLGEKYTDLSGLLANSKNLVSTLLKSTKSDTWYLETALYILSATIIWLIFRRLLYGPLTWFVWWPLKLVYKLFLYPAFVAAGLAGSKAANSASVSGRLSTSLIVKPSATGGPPQIPGAQRNNPEARYVRVGGGGKGYMQDPSPRGSYSQQVGKMAEESQQQERKGEKEEAHPQLREKKNDEKEEQVRRGDGTVLEESDRKRNPKKKMWEEDVESGKTEVKGGETRERDEL